MSVSRTVSVKPSALDRYDQLCAEHETSPTPAQVQEIEIAAGDLNSHAKDRLEHALLYFVPRSTAVFRKDTLLIGWIRTEHGSKQELWYKQGGKQGSNKACVCNQSGGPTGSYVKRNRSKSLCDEWHPSLEAFCIPNICNDRLLLYAYFAATVNLINASSQPPSIESPQVRPNIRISLRRSLDDESLIEDDNTPLTDTATPERQPPTKKARTSEPVESAKHSESVEDARQQLVTIAPTVDLTESDSEEYTKSEPRTIAVPSLQVHHEVSSTPPAKRKLLDKLQSKKAHEIDDILTKQAGQLPNWIEKTMREERDRKMSRDLEAIENLL